MNTRTASLFLPAQNGAETFERRATLQCFHCGLPVPPDSQFEVEIEQRVRPMCCAGCATVAGTIVRAGLLDFYHHRRGYSDTIDLASLPAPFAAAPDAGTPPPRQIEDNVKTDLYVYLNGLRCSACVWLAEQTLARLTGLSSAAVNLTTHSARIRYAPSQLSEAAILGALSAVGLRAETASQQSRMAARKQQRRTQLLEFGVAGLCMMQVMMLVVPIYLADPSDISHDAKQLMSWTAWLLTLPVLLFSAQPIFLSAFRTAAHTVGRGYLGMDVPVALALLLTFASSTVALVTQSGHHYFDAITMFVFLLLGARWLESTLRLRTAESIDRLTNARPLQCHRLSAFPQSEATTTVRADQLAPGDYVSIQPGEVVPADAVVIRGTSELNEALVTGESRVVARGVGDGLIGGTVNTSSPLLARVTAVGDDSLLAHLGKMVESSLAYRPAFQGLAELTARWLAPATLVAAALAAAIWWQIDRGRAAEVAIAVLAITCPCAFALAAPAALASALSRLTRDGLLIARGHLVETMAGATDVVFDKTGTLTTGEMCVVGMLCDHADNNATDVQTLLGVAVAMERGASHPLAKAINTYAMAQRAGDAAAIPVATSLVTLPGQGVEAIVDGHTYRLGRLDFALPVELRARPDILRTDPTQVRIALCRVSETSHQNWLLFTLSDPLRADATDCAASLRAAGIRVHLLSGDSKGVVETTATTLGIAAAQVRAGQTPTQKRDYVATLVGAGARVVAIGDGVNDAPMLATANGSIGLASGATLTRLSADAVLASNQGRLLSTLSRAFALARQTRSIIKQNLFWALLYNVIALPLAFAGLVTPLIAAAGMALSSLVVVINASRLARSPQPANPANVTRAA
jgi:P-type Cu2+ transporter